VQEPFSRMIWKAVKTGTLGILERAALRALIDLPTAIAQLQATTFYGPPDIIATMLARDAARRRPM
jgi:hypothetical protein